MKKNLKKLVNLLNFFKNKKAISDIPKTIYNLEKIARVLFFPGMMTKNKENIRSNAFRTLPNIDEVSVIRLDYYIPDFCKKQDKKIQKPERDRSYFGLAVLNALEI